VPAGLAILLAAGCTGHDTGPGAGAAPAAAAGPSSGPAWQAVTLPASGPGRPEVRDLAACGGHWYAAGGYLLPDGSTRPALWSSTDAQTWTPVPTAPVSFYGPIQLLSAVACRDDTAVALGGAAGGAHANLRVSSWLSTGGGPLDEIASPFELFNGNSAIGTGRITAGPAGWLITGSWQDANGRAGASVWFSADGRDFRLVDADPELESDARGQTTAADAVLGPAGGSGTGGFTVVGSLITPGSRTIARDPVVWTSSDGLTWRRSATPATSQDEALERAVPYRDGVLALGERGNGFGAWLGTAGGWRAVGRFGGFTGTGLPVVAGLAVGASQRAYTIIGDGTRYRLWASSDLTRWTELALPATVTSGGQRRFSIAGAEGRLLLAAEDGSTTRLWTATG
jgi:hypothetical protein